ncbi:LysE family transporter [Candidatus Puniceispirillum sp.]|nr:LysE family transporter [Candidatus Puniceispirillum sp.]
MLVAYLTGLMLSLSLIFAIGSQNAFVLRQAILRQHIRAVILFCAISDGLLIMAGVFGVSFFIKSFVNQFTPWLFGGAAIWLIGYGLIRAHDAFGNELLMPDDRTVGSLSTTLLALAILTFGNPHVYLDTVVLIGTISLQFNGFAKLAFAFGAITASSVFFVGIGYSGYLLSRVMRRPRAWRALNAGTALIMFGLAAAMLRAGGWF